MTLTRGTNGKGEEIGSGLPTTVVSVVHSEHPSGGAHGTESLRSEIQDTWISPIFFWGGGYLAFFFVHFLDNFIVRDLENGAIPPMRIFQLGYWKVPQVPLMIPLGSK